MTLIPARSTSGGPHTAAARRSDWVRAGTGPCGTHQSSHPARRSDGRTTVTAAASYFTRPALMIAKTPDSSTTLIILSRLVLPLRGGGSSRPSWRVRFSKMWCGCSITPRRTHGTDKMMPVAEIQLLAVYEDKIEVEYSRFMVKDEGLAWIGEPGVPGPQLPLLVVSGLVSAGSGRARESFFPARRGVGEMLRCSMRCSIRSSPRDRGDRASEPDEGIPAEDGLPAGRRRRWVRFAGAGLGGVAVLVLGALAAVNGVGVNAGADFDLVTTSRASVPPLAPLATAASAIPAAPPIPPDTAAPDTAGGPDPRPGS